MHSVVNKQLSKIKNKKVFFEPLGGNNGDTLIEMGAKTVLEKNGIQLVKTPTEAEIIVINGSGDLSYVHDDQPIAETRQSRLITKYHQTPVILLPSSCTVANAQKLSTPLKKRSAETILIARDNYSFENLKKLSSPQVKIYCDHDMAFGLLGSSWLENKKTESTTSENLLVIERFDAEAATVAPAIYSKTDWFRKVLPAGMKSALKHIFLNKIQESTPFVKESTKLVADYIPHIAYNNIQAADISLPRNYTFEEFIASEQRASIVISTRLHGCILAALLGKPFIAVQFKGGLKLKGVFEKSLQSFPNAYLHIKES
ncbi:MAG: polysaccharide pyruvyl transferase family protein [Leeuwenhoekiella sp.]